MVKTVITALLVFVLSVPTYSKTFKVDAKNSTVLFAAKHLNLINIYGRFTKFNGKINWDPETQTLSKVQGKIDVRSLFTGNEKRDESLLTDVFNRKKYKRIIFKSLSVKKEGDLHMAKGILHMNGKSVKAILPIQVVGPEKDHRGKNRIGIKTEYDLDLAKWGFEVDDTIDNTVKVIIEAEAY